MLLAKISEPGETVPLNVTVPEAAASLKRALRVFTKSTRKPESCCIQFLGDACAFTSHTEF